MALFQQPRWLRRLIRRNTNPIPLDRAHLWKRRLSLFYAVVAWNAFGGVCYMIYTGRNDWAKFYGYKTEEEAQLPPAIRYAQQLNVPNAKVLKLSGLTIKDEYELKEMEVIRMSRAMDDVDTKQESS